MKDLELLFKFLYSHFFTRRYLILFILFIFTITAPFNDFSLIFLNITCRILIIQFFTYIIPFLHSNISESLQYSFYVYFQHIKDNFFYKNFKMLRKIYCKNEILFCEIISYFIIFFIFIFIFIFINYNDYNDFFISCAETFFEKHIAFSNGNDIHRLYSARLTNLFNLYELH